MIARNILLPAAILMTATTGFAAERSLLDDASLGKDRYDRCLALIKRNPGTAIDQANGWAKEGGGAAALHCDALALVELKRYAEAAEKLEEAVHNSAVKAAGERAALLDQAGNAWLLAGKPDKANAAFSASLTAVPQDEDVLVDRARARGLLKDWSGADADLSAVLSLDSDRADALVLRASARHALGRTAEASADVARALELYPDYPEALLERGNIKFESGDLSGARADWQQVITDAPGTDSAAAAEVRIESLTSRPAPH